jgi:hypothetical protein
MHILLMSYVIQQRSAFVYHACTQLGSLPRTLAPKPAAPAAAVVRSVGRAGAAAAVECPGIVASLSNLMFMSEHRVQQLIDKHPEVRRRAAAGAVCVAGLGLCVCDCVCGCTRVADHRRY